MVNLESLEKANLIDRNTKRVKVMLSGDVTKAVTVEGIRVTAGARAAIEAAGGKVVDAEAAAPKAAKAKKAPKAEAPAAEADSGTEDNSDSES